VFHPPTPGSHGKAKAVMSQRRGDPLTGFVVEGRNWLPGSTVTLTLVGVPHSSALVYVDAAGTFYYVINEGHKLFPFGIPPNIYRVVVRGTNNVHASAGFTVLPPPGGGPPPPQ
jgi:hypothetical protein